MNEKGLIVGFVLEDSIAKEIGLEAGDTVISIDGHKMTDLLDYYFYTKNRQIVVEVKRADGESWEIDIEKDFDQELGIEFKKTGLEKIARCANSCIFCFVDQMPGGMRDSLYIKDDDYRLSFLQGSFITLTNTTENALKRIARLRLSPLYVSVHTTNPELRKKIMGNSRAGEIIRQLEYLTDNGIEIHTQAVICPDVNDGVELEKTIEDLAGMWPGVKSLAVVPVGLTGFRKGLFPARQFTGAEASGIVSSIKKWQNTFYRSINYPFVFASDEFYLLAGKDIPSRKWYADFPQTENGVGLTRLFIDDWNGTKKRLPPRIRRPLKILLLTGVLGEKILQPVAAHLNTVENLQAEILAVPNEFFGNSVTVAGLLTGKDILKHIKELKNSDIVILPSSLLKKGESVLLDGTTLGELERRAGVPLVIAEGPENIVNIIKKMTGEKNE